MGSRRFVVLVDDSADEAEFVRRAIAAACPGAEFRAFRGGAEALEQLPNLMEGAPPAVLLLDLKLPGLNGHAILKELRRRWTAGELPVVVFTSSREPSDVRKAYDAGANSYVVKPVAFEEYSSVVALMARYWLEMNTPATRGA